MERLKDVAQLPFAETIEVSHNPIEFVDHVFFLIIFQATTLCAYGLCPMVEPMIRRSEPSRKGDDAIG